jgi:hypothetical protein
MFTIKAIIEKITSRWFKPRKASEPYGSPKLAPLKYNPIDVEELKAIFQEFNSKPSITISKRIVLLVLKITMAIRNFKRAFREE